MIDLDLAINQSCRESSDIAASSCCLDASIDQTPGAKGWLPRSKYETPVSFKVIQDNLILVMLISRPNTVLASSAARTS